LEGYDVQNYTHFTFDSMIWRAPAICEEINCLCKLRNNHNPYAVALKKTTGGEDMVVVHVPQRISAICLLFARRGVQFFARYQEVEAILRIYCGSTTRWSGNTSQIDTNTATSKEETTKVKKLLEGVLCIDVTQNVTICEKRVEATSGVSNSAPIANVSCKFGQSASTSEEVVNLLDHQPHLQRNNQDYWL